MTSKIDAAIDASWKKEAPTLRDMEEAYKIGFCKGALYTIAEASK